MADHFDSNVTPEEAYTESLDTHCFDCGREHGQCVCEDEYPWDGYDDDRAIERISEHLIDHFAGEYEWDSDIMRDC